MVDVKNCENEINVLPWISCLIEEKEFVIKYMFLQESYHIMISDLVHLYHEELSGSDIQERCENFNPGVEMSVKRVVEHIKKCVEDCLKPTGPYRTRNKVSILNQAEQSLKLKLESSLAQITFVWTFAMDAMKPLSLSTHLLLPLIGMVTELKRRNQELVQIIKSKDEEIEDYKTSGAKVTRKRLETKQFIESDFVEQMNKSEVIFESLKESTKTALNDSLYIIVVSTQECLKRKAPEAGIGDKNETGKKTEAKQSDCHKTSAEGYGIQNVKEEMQRRVFLQQQLDLKIEKKAKKKKFKI